MNGCWCLKVNVFDNGLSSLNVLNRDKELSSITNEYKNIYEKHFINFNQDVRFDYLVDQGNMLIISFGDFIDEMQPLVDWKNMKGIPTEIVNVEGLNAIFSIDTVAIDGQLEVSCGEIFEFLIQDG